MYAQTGLEPGPDCATADAEPDGLVEPESYRTIVSYRSRRSALSDSQRETWERRWPELGRRVDTRPVPAAAALLDIEHWFGRAAPVVVEVGCGNGTSTLAMAELEPDIDVIAVEMYRRGLAQLLCAIDRANVTNIRLLHADAIAVLEQLIKPASLAGVRVFFPDPWPKARHHKRRLLQPASIALIADRLRPGGVLHAATDHAGYAKHIARAGDAEPRLRRTDPGLPAPVSLNRPLTKYEAKAQEAGSAVAELRWTRCGL